MGVARRWSWEGGVCGFGGGGDALETAFGFLYTGNLRSLGDREDLTPHIPPLATPLLLTSYNGDNRATCTNGSLKPVILASDESARGTRADLGQTRHE